jgi:hypothetical protein
MNTFSTKHEKKLFIALKNLVDNSIDKIGMVKTPSIKQIEKSIQVLADYEKDKKLI